MSELSLVRRQLFSLRFQGCLYGRQLGVPVDRFFDEFVNKGAGRGLAMHERRRTKDRLAVGCKTNVDLRVFATHVAICPCDTVRCSTSWDQKSSSTRVQRKGK